MFIDLVFCDHVIRGLILTWVALAWIIILLRINGLRSFSKMTNFDFVSTVATGSLLAGAAQSSDWTGFAQTMAAIAGIFMVQFTLSWARSRSDRFEDAIQNRPVLLMRDGAFIDDGLRETRVAKDDLIAKLREANVLDLTEVRAVVLETTGDVSVLHGRNLDEVLLCGVRCGA